MANLFEKYAQLQGKVFGSIEEAKEAIEESGTPADKAVFKSIAVRKEASATSSGTREFFDIHLQVARALLDAGLISKDGMRAIATVPVHVDLREGKSRSKVIDIGI